MPFDPKSFLASEPPAPKAGGFDPKAFLSGGASAPAPDSGPSTVQEMHPDFSEADRFVVKNFSNNDEAAVNYLQKRHPNLEIAVDDKTKQIKARARDGSDGGNYKVLDPDTGFSPISSPMEALRDVGDSAYDLGSGALSTLASGASGVAGAAAGGVGAIPAAMAGGGAASAGLEGLRQKLGQALGIPQEVNYGDVALTGAAGAINPLLFGSGASASQVAKGALKSGLTEDAIGAAQKGLGSRLWDTVKSPVGNMAAKIGAAVSGAPEDAIKTFATKNPEYKALESNPEGVLNFIDQTGSMVNEKARAAKSAAWDEFQKAIEASGTDATVDTKPIQAKFQAAIGEAKKYADESGTNASKDLYSQLQGAFDNHFTREVPLPDGSVGREAIGSLSPASAVQLESELGDLAGFTGMKDKVAGSRFSSGQSKAEKKLMNLAADMKKDLSAQTEKVLPPNAIPAKQRYGEIANLESSVDKLMTNPRQAFANLRNSDITSNATNQQIFGKMDRVLGTDLLERAKMANTMETFNPGRKSWFSSIRERTPATVVGGGAGYLLGGGMGGGEGEGGSAKFGALAGGLTGGLLGSAPAIRKYIESGILANSLASKVPATVKNAAALKLITEPETRSIWKDVK